MSFEINKTLYIRRFIFVLLISLTSILAHSRGLLPQIGKASAMALIPLVVCIAMYEKSVIGLFFGAFAGIMWDGFSVTADGFFAITLAVIGFFCGAMITLYLRTNFVTALILSFVSTSVCTILYWLFFIVGNGYDSVFYILTEYYLPGIAYTMVFVPLYYYVIKAVVNREIKS